MQLRRKSDFPHAHIVTGLFYYVAVLILVTMFSVGVFWQLEKDPNTFELTTSETISKTDDKSFFVSLNYCTPQVIDLRIIRYYLDVENDVYFTVPDGIYQTTQGCSKTKIQGHTGRLDPGKYEYRVYGNYKLNPLRDEQVMLASVKVTVE